MRQTALLGVLICCLLPRAELAYTKCDLSDAQEAGDRTFPDIIKQSFAGGYQFTVEFANSEVEETVYVDEYYNAGEKSGKLDIYRNGDFKQFFYKQETDETFTISGYNCETGNLKSVPVFLEDQPKRWIYYGEDRTILGPSAAIEQGLMAWEKDKSKVVYAGDVTTDRGMKLDKWKQCIGDDTIEYYFSAQTWRNVLNLTDLQIPVAVKYISEKFEHTYEYFGYKPYLTDLTTATNVPDGYGCNRTAKNEVPVPEFTNINHLMSGEMVYYAFDLDARKISRFISNFQFAYHDKSQMISYTYSPWDTASTDKDGTTKAGPYTRTIWDNRNSIFYVLDLDSRTCQLGRNSQFYPSFELPGGDGEGAINLLDPNIFISSSGFHYLGKTMDRDLKVNIFEKEVRPFFLGGELTNVAIITRTHAINEVIINTGNQEINSPVSITIKLFEDDKKTKINGILIMNIYSYANDIPYAPEYFDTRMCFRDYDASMWLKVTFPNMGVWKEDLIAHGKRIKNNFLGVLFQHTETTPIRIPRLLLDVTDEDFSVDALILERPPYEVEFVPRGNYQLSAESARFGMISQHECLKQCVDYSNNHGEHCQTVSFCGATCHVAVAEKANATAYKGCTLFDRQVISESLPSMDDLATSIRKLVATDQFSITFPINVGDQMDVVTFTASGFSDSVGDTRDRLVPRLFREGKFSLSYAGKKLIKGDNDQISSIGKASLGACMQVCLNDPYCDTLSYCREKECLISERYASSISLDQFTNDNKCIVLGRNYLQAYRNYSGIFLTRTAENEVTAKDADGCAMECTKEKRFTCRSFDFCKEKGQCLLHTKHYFDLKDESQSAEISGDCSHFSKRYVYDYRMMPNKRIVGDAQMYVRRSTVEECAKECRENGAFVCTAFDFCSSTEPIDNKCFLISTDPDDIKTVEAPNCRHYRDTLQSSTIQPKEEKGKRYSNGLAGGVGFLMFLIGSAIGVGGTYFFAFRYANRR